MKKKKLGLALAIGTITAIVTGAIGFFIWIHTPYFAIQQIGTSLAKRDSKTFYEYIDTATLINGLTTELLYVPAMNTPSLSEFQRYIANGALIITKNRIDHALYNGINRLVMPLANVSSKPASLSIARREALRDLLLTRQARDEWNLCYFEQRDDEGFENKILFVNDEDKKPETINLNDFAKSVGQELKVEQRDMQKLVAKRMQEYLNMRQDRLIGKLFGVSRGAGSIKAVVAEYGFQKENIRTMYFHTDEDRQVCTLEFYSPRIRANVPLSVELIPVSPGEVLSKWKVIRMWKLKESFIKLGEDTDHQIQELVAYAMQDVTPRHAVDRTGNLLKRLGEHESTQKLWKQLQGKF